MENIILGLLLIKSATGYEIRNCIKMYFSLICSASAGSIQVTFQKLLSKKLIMYEEYVEKGVHKKLYSITDAGREVFFKWEEDPLNHKKAKNIELVKLFFLGTVDEIKRKPLLLAHIEQLSTEKKYLLNLKKEVTKSIEPKLLEFAADKKKLDLLKFQLLTLEFGIDEIEFKINWYKNVVEKFE